MPEVGEFLDNENAFLPVYNHPVVGKEVKDLAEGCFMLLIGVTGNEDIIQINKDKRDVAKNAIHHPLECLGRILKPEGKQRNSQSLKGVMSAI